MGGGGVRVVGCQGVGSVKVNEIDPCAIKTSLTQTTGVMRPNI